MSMAWKSKIFRQNKLETTFSNRQKAMAFQKRFQSIESSKYLWKRLKLGVKKHFT
jgi:hypothetical protein